VKRFWIVVSLLLVASAAAAQAPPGGSTTVEVDPIRCWWRTSTNAVRIAEIFDLSLTCAVLENEAVQVIPDESRLGAAGIQLAPFEVVAGSHPADLRSGSRRFFQYHYKLRVIGPDVIGKDVALPPVTIHYTINSQVAANTAVQGRDLLYVLPTATIRVASLVPAAATDIRDAAGEDFANVERFELRANLLEIVAIASASLGILMSAIVLVRLARRSSRRTPTDERLLSTGRLAAAAAAELTAVQREREQQGWNAALVSRALAATRLAASCAIGANTNQRIAVPSTQPGEGRLIVKPRFRGKARMVSAATTAAAVSQMVAAASDPAHAQMLENVRDALAAFTASQYARDAALDESALDTALSSGMTAARQVSREHGWLKTFLKQLRTGGAPAETRA
jgi:hypothetical protein